MGSRYQTQVLSPVYKHPYPLRRLVSPLLCFYLFVHLFVHSFIFETRSLSMNREPIGVSSSASQ